MWHIPTSVPPEWGVWAIFLSVLVTQIGVPIPAAPMLILGGTMIALGEGSFTHMLLAAVAATLLADTLWFTAGRSYGRQVLNRIVRFSLSLDTTVRVARNHFERFGAPLLAVSKFVPGLGLISAPLMGSTAMDIKRFLFWDGVGAALWASFWLLGGAALEDQVIRLVLFARQNGGTVADVLIVAAIAFLAYRWMRRIQFRRWLAKFRISPDQLDELLRSTAPPLVLDARPLSVQRREAYRIPGAVPLDLSSPDRLDEHLLGRPLVVYCVCPNEATAKRIIGQLHRKGIDHARALKGGLDAWQKRGFPVEPIPDIAAPAANDAGRPPPDRLDPALDPVLDSEYTVRAATAK